MRFLGFQLVRFFVQVITRIIGFTAMMLVISIFAVFRGIWTQSDFVAIALKRQFAFGSWDGHSDGPMYWTIRIIALFLMLVSLIVLAEGLSRLVESLVRL